MTPVPADGTPSPDVAASPPEATPELADLLHRCALGDHDAFAELYDRTSARLYGLTLRILRNPSHAEEVTQESYLELWRHAARFDPTRGSALTWMLTLAHRRAVDRVRSVESQTRRDENFETGSHHPAFDSTVEAAHIRLDSERVRRALGTLTEHQRQAVELAYFGGYTHTEIARLLDLPLGTAKTRIRDGLIRLRDTLGLDR